MDAMQQHGHGNGAGSSVVVWRRDVMAPGLSRSMTTAWSSLSRASKRLVAIATLMVAISAAALAIMLWQLHEDALANTRRNLSTLGTAVAEQTSRSMQAADLVLEDLRRQVAARQLGTVDDFKARLADEDTHALLQNRANSLPQVSAFALVAADGMLVNVSRQWPAPYTDLSDRDYFRYFFNHDSTAAFVSEPVRSRGNGAWTIYVVRRIAAPGGQFVGMVLAAVNLEYFRDFFKTLQGEAGMSTALLNRDGTLLTSYPAVERIGMAVPASSPWRRIVAKGPGTYETDTAMMPGLRVVSAHPLQDYPLVVNVGITKDKALAAWMQVTFVAGQCAAVAVVCVLLLIRAQLRQFQRLERSERLVAHRNMTLEAAQHRVRSQANELAASRAAAAEQSAALQTALAHMNQGIMMVGQDGHVAVCNARAMAMLDLPPALIAKRPTFAELVAFQRMSGEFVKNTALPSTEERMGRPGTYERERPNGRILEIQTVPMKGGGMVRTFTDITERRRSERQVQFLASHDPLTGLLNRAGFGDSFATMLAEASACGQHLAVYYLDLDGFKPINDTHGHAVGDKLLAAVAERLHGATREGDVVARMGGDEFAIVQAFAATDGTHAPSFDVDEFALRMVSALTEPFRLGDVRCAISVSVGVALFPEHSTTAAELLQQADTALYRAKGAGKRTFRVFDPALDDGQRSMSRMEQDLARALAEGQFALHYQPIVDAHTLQAVRFEALLRWTHPERGPVPPGEFIGVAERCGLIVPIGLWVLETACATAATWPWPAEVSVNLSPLQFARGDLVDQVERVLDRTGLPPGRLNLEVTEGVLLENSTAVLQAMARLRQVGIRFSLDDFGIAHAGLTYLRRFSFDVMKIDKSFVQDAVRSAEARGILTAMQTIGAACNLQVVAEGVETEAELALVRELRCGFAQGYLIGRPAPMAAQPLSAQPASGSGSPRQPRLSLVQT